MFARQFARQWVYGAIACAMMALMVVRTESMCDKKEVIWSMIVSEGNFWNAQVREIASC